MTKFKAKDIKMKKLLYIILAILLTQQIFADDNLKVISYNIWNGFDWGKDQHREELFVQWAKDENPDVMALQELCGFNEKKLAQLAQKYGHKYSAILKSDGYPVGITSKKPITNIERHLDNYWHGMLTAKTFGINFFVIHLSPSEWQFRNKEAKMICEKITELNNTENIIVLGDFNSYSPFDAHQHKFNNKVDCHYETIAKFLSVSLIDVVQKFTQAAERYSFPTPILFDTKDLDIIKNKEERIDYIFTNSDLSKKCISAEVQNRGMTEKLSDHYPVITIFNMEKSK